MYRYCRWTAAGLPLSRTHWSACSQSLQAQQPYSERCLVSGAARGVSVPPCAAPSTAKQPRVPGRACCARHRTSVRNAARPLARFLVVAYATTTPNHVQGKRRDAYRRNLVRGSVAMPARAARACGPSDVLFYRTCTVATCTVPLSVFVHTCDTVRMVPTRCPTYRLTRSRAVADIRNFLPAGVRTQIIQNTEYRMHLDYMY
eukprot:COSAG02_NODE_3034_length_7504_cov_13.653477_7_plen_202_part_00